MHHTCNRWKSVHWTNCPNCKLEFRTAACSICHVWQNTTEVWDDYIRHVKSHPSAWEQVRQRIREESKQRFREDPKPKPEVKKSRPSKRSERLDKLRMMTVANGCTPAEERSAKKLIRKLEEKFS